MITDNINLMINLFKILKIEDKTILFVRDPKTNKLERISS